MSVLVRGLFTFACLVLVLVSCGGPPAPVPTRVEVSPTGVLLTPGAPERTLTARVFDQFGAVMDVPVTWESSAPGDVGVADGVVTAARSIGSAVVTARAGKAAASVLVVAAEPVAGAVIVSDDQVDGDAVPVSEGTPFGPGYQYRVKLVGAEPPPVGAVLMTSGAKAVAGRVVAVAGAVVTLEMVSLGELFAGLELDAKLDLATVEFTTAVENLGAFSTTRAPDGSLRARLRGPRTVTAGAALEPQAEWQAGRFKCEAEAQAVTIGLQQADLDFAMNLTYEVVWNEDRKAIVIGGAPTVTIAVTPMLEAGIAGEIECTFTFGEITVPLPGPLGLFLGAVVPVGAGFTLGGEVPIAGVGLAANARVGATFRAGFDCQAECVAVNELGSILEGGVEPRLPSSLGLNTIKLEAKPFLFAKLEGGARFVRALRVEAIEAEAGLLLEAEVASEKVQADDPDVAASYEASFVASVGAGDDFEAFLGLIQVEVGEFEFPYRQSLGRSPTGTVRADREAFTVGEVVTFVVTLDPATVDFPVLGYNVKRVRVYRRGEGSLIFAYEVTAAPGQTQFSVPWAATVDGEIGSNFIAFVETKMPGVGFLEIGVAQPGEPVSGVGTFEYEEVIVEEDEWVEGGDYSRGHSEERIKVDVLVDGVTLEVLSGSVVYEFDSEVEDYYTVTTDEECPYTARRLRRYTSRATARPQAGGRAAPSLEVSFGDPGYSLWFDYDGWFARETYSESETWEVTFTGPSEDCFDPPPDRHEENTYEYDDWSGSVSAHADTRLDPNARAWSDVIEESETETDGPFTDTRQRTVRWSFTLP